MATQRTRKNSTTWQDVRPVQRPTVHVAPKKSKFAFSLPPLPTIPFLKKTTDKMRRIKRKRLVAGIALVVILLVLVGSYSLLTPRLAKSTDDTQTQEQTASPTLKKGTPEYPTVIPTGKNIKDLGGWTRISPPDSEPVFTYTDKIGTQPINVSQQLLPEDFATDTDQKVESLAEGFMANEKITIGNTIIHIGSSKDGAQSVIFSKNNLLILIKSSVRIDNNQWAEYINLLQ